MPKTTLIEKNVLFSTNVSFQDGPTDSIPSSKGKFSVMEKLILTFKDLTFHVHQFKA